jgi:hypothetical protein
MNSKHNNHGPLTRGHRQKRLAREVHGLRRQVQWHEQCNRDRQRALEAILCRLTALQADIDALKKDAERQDRNHDDFRAWTDGFLRHLHIWIEGLGYQIYPQAQKFPDELRRIFPRGFADVPNYRLRRKTPHGS